MKTIEEIKAQIIKDNVGINHENDEALYHRIVDEFMKRGFPLTYDLFDEDYTFVTIIKGNVNTLDYNYAKDFSINIITLEEFITRYPLEEREIIGYVFKDLNKWCEFDRVNKEWLKGIYKNNGFHFSKGCNLYDRLVNIDLLEILCEPVYKEESNPDDFDSTIKELGFVKVENEKLSNRLMIEHKEYLLEYEGYAYVLYKIIKKEIPSAKLQLKEPIAHFQDANKLKAFVNILKDQF